MRQTQKGLLTACTTSNLIYLCLHKLFINSIFFFFDTESARIQQLKNQIKDKRKLLEESLKRKSRFDNYHPDNQALEKAWLRTHKITVGTRRILVKETTSLFELKPGLIEEPETPVIQHPELPASGESFIPVEQDLYICGVTLSSRLIDVSSKLLFRSSEFF